MNRSITHLGKEWKYSVAGNGTLPLLILSGSLGATEGIAAYLGRHLNFCRVILPQYAAAESIKKCLAALDLILEQKRIDHFAILGGSFGGLVAQCMARQLSDRITHLILSSTSLPDPKRIRANQRALKIMPLIPMICARLLLRLFLATMLRGVKDPDGSKNTCF